MLYSFGGDCSESLREGEGEDVSLNVEGRKRFKAGISDGLGRAFVDLGFPPFDDVAIGFRPTMKALVR